MSAIPTELRRSAICDEAPLYGMASTAWYELTNWTSFPQEWTHDLRIEDLRIFILLVSYAVESEP